MLVVRHFDSFSALPATYAPFVAQLAQQRFFNDRAWFEFVMKHFFADYSELRLYVVEDASSGLPLLLAALRYSVLDGAVPYARTLAAVSHTENFCPLPFFFAADVADRGEVLVTLFRHLKTTLADEQPPRFDVLRLSPIGVGSDLAATVYRALRRSGFWVQAYANSFNRFENTDGIGFEDYLARRSANHRYNVRRRQRSLEKGGALEIRLYRDETDLGQGIDDYIAVSRASWKEVELTISFPLLQLIRLTASKGCLRLGILRLAGRPVAAQFWIVTGGVAHCIRLSYDEAYKKQAVGVVLTAAMIAHVLDVDHVGMMDFGYGEEDYKAGWMQDCRHYAGYLAFNPATRRGLYYGLKHIVGRPLKRGLKWALSRVARRQAAKTAAAEA